MKTGIELIANERKRQIEKEGWTPDHDQEHSHDELSEAARCYVTSSIASRFSKNCMTYDKGWRPGEGVPRDWPFDPKWWKPTGNPVKDLIKAGALIAAEIDRLNAIENGKQSILPPDKIDMEDKKKIDALQDKINDMNTDFEQMVFKLAAGYTFKPSDSKINCKKGHTYLPPDYICRCGRKMNG